MADLRTIGMDVPVIRDPRAERFARDLDPDELTLHPLALDAPECFLAEVVRRLALVDGPSQSDLVRIVVEDDVRAVVQDPRLDPPNLRGRDRPDVVSCPSGRDLVPQRSGVLRIAEVQLVSALRAPSRPREDERDAVEVRLREMVVLEIQDPIAEEVDHDVFRLRPLELEGG